MSSQTGGGTVSSHAARSVVYGAVLVGGRSVRMGRDKRTLGLGGSTFVERAVLPRSAGGLVEPVLAVYEPQARRLLGQRAASGRWGLQHLAEDARVWCPTPPAELMAAWADVNTPQELNETAKRLYDGACRA